MALDVDEIKAWGGQASNAGQQVWSNLSPAELVEASLNRGEAQLSASGALRALTGTFTGRSPKDRYIVKEPSSEEDIAWGSVNQPLSQEHFEELYQSAMQYLRERPEVFLFDGFGGADLKYRLPIRVITEYAWHNLFAHQLFIRPTDAELKRFQPEFALYCLPGFQADPKIHGTKSEVFIAISFERRCVLIGGTQYAGEMKKSIFSVLNYLLPKQGVLPMHCSANVGEAGDTALFFGLSGTGKTTLSTDPRRRLVGDDEHGWTDEGIFNFEGGCYAKCIRLSKENEPQIWNAIRFGTILENVELDRLKRTELYDSDIYTENTRAAYPLDYIPGALIPSTAGHPQTILFLAADAFGVLPPISRLDNAQAMYHFLSGYTSKLAGTERGVTDPEATFSSCFGEPFLPLSPALYAQMLGERIKKHGSRVYLVNTGWVGGPYGIGERMKLAHTRSMIRAVLAGELDHVSFRQDPVFGVSVPEHCPDVPAEILDARGQWQDPAAYDEKAAELAGRFIENFKRFQDVPQEVLAAAPRVIV